jgi:transglutaminase-like putative cysteine protease
VFAFLLAAFLWADRLRGPEAPLAATLLAIAVLAGAIVAPRVDARNPWIDYEGIAESLQAGKTTAFSWNHTYAPLNWPRDGREMLRIKARRPAYWKAETLEQFDGSAWRQVPTAGPGGADTEGIDSHPGWIQRLEVTVRGLRSTAFVAAGTTLRVDDSSRLVGASAPGTFRTLNKPLRRGDGYIATSYVPRPGEVQMRTAGTAYPAFVRRQLAVEVPGEPAVQSALGPVEVSFPPFRSGGLPTARVPSSGFFNIDADGVLRRGAYGRAYALAQQLASASSDPYDFVRRVQTRVRRDATYTETPPDPGRLPPLVAFLFRDHAGYCQHFSGAMALLLRMGGVPARVATGFSPGSQDGDSRVVRDVDAHSWVEVYFPRIGWTTFDPTPADSPARSQIADLEQPAAAPGDRPQTRASGDRASDPTAGGAAAADSAGSSGADPLPLVGSARWTSCTVR